MQGAVLRRRAFVFVVCWALSIAQPEEADVPIVRSVTIGPEDVRHGLDIVDAMARQVSSRGVLEHLLGGDCHARAVARLGSDCRDLSTEVKSRLALELVRCQLVAHGEGWREEEDVEGKDDLDALRLAGGDPHAHDAQNIVSNSSTHPPQRSNPAPPPCHDRTPLSECVRRLSSRAWTLYVGYLSHVDSLCLLHAHQLSRRHAAAAAEALARGAALAQDGLAEVGRRAARIERGVRGLEDRAARAQAALEGLHEVGQQTREAVELAKAELQRHVEAVHSAQRDTLQRQTAMLQQQDRLSAQQDALRNTLDVEGRSLQRRLLQLHAAAADVAGSQRSLLADMQLAAAGADRVAAAVASLARAQQRSETLLLQTLGSGAGWADALFWVGGMLTALALPQTASHKVGALLCGAAACVLERWTVAQWDLLVARQSLQEPKPGDAWLPTGEGLTSQALALLCAAAARRLLRVLGPRRRWIFRSAWAGREVWKACRTTAGHSREAAERLGAAARAHTERLVHLLNHIERQVEVLEKRSCGAGYQDTLAQKKVDHRLKRVDRPYEVHDFSRGYDVEGRSKLRQRLGTLVPASSAPCATLLCSEDLPVAKPAARRPLESSSKLSLSGASPVATTTPSPARPTRGKRKQAIAGLDGAASPDRRVKRRR